MTVDEAVAKIKALRKLSRDSGVVTRRAQNKILIELSEADLAEVALQLEWNGAELNEHDRK